MNYAYCTFIIKNDSYLPGALVFAYSLKKQGTDADLICFVTEEISEDAIRSLKTLYDKVILTDQIITSNKRKQKRQDVTKLFNRFQALLLDNKNICGKVYDKIIIADIDVIAIKKWDKIFNICAPAGVINESKSHTMEYTNAGEYIIPQNYYKDKEWIWHKIYKSIPQGHPIPKEITDRVLTNKNNMGVNAAIYLLEPSTSMYNEIIQDINTEKTKKMIENFNWPEMQYITQKLSGKWHNIDIKYASISGYPSLDFIYGIHFVGLKPWSFKNKSLKTFARYDDFKLWYVVFKKMMKEQNSLNENKLLKNLLSKIVCLTSDSKYQFDKYHLDNLKNLLN